jgi:hypothetical protein
VTLRIDALYLNPGEYTVDSGSATAGRRGSTTSSRRFSSSCWIRGGGDRAESRRHRPRACALRASVASGSMRDGGARTLDGRLGRRGFPRCRR